MAEKSTTTPRRLTPAEQAEVNASAAEALGLREVHVETINARPISFAEIQAIADGQQDTFKAYVKDDAGFLSPVEVGPHHALRPTRNGVNDTLRAYYRAVPDPRASTDADQVDADDTLTINVRQNRRGPAERSLSPKDEMTHPYEGKWVADKDTVAGHLVRMEAKSVFGTTHELRLFTTPEAEESARLLHGERRASEDRLDLYVEDSDADPAMLMPIFGSEVTINATLKDLDPEEVKARVEKALAAEFGDALTKNTQVRTRPVKNRRVDVFDAVEHTPLAIGILVSETSLVMRGSHGIETRSHNPGATIMTGEQ